MKNGNGVEIIVRMGIVFRVWPKDDEDRVIKVAVVKDDKYYKELLNVKKPTPMQKVVHAMVLYWGQSRVAEMIDEEKGPGIDIEEETTCWLTKGPIVVKKKREESAMSFLQDLSKLLG